jgi:hypothetical protein
LATSYNFPDVVSVSHPTCVANGVSLEFCPVSGGGLLTIAGSDFIAGYIVVYNNFCINTTITVSSNSQIVCTLAPALASYSASVTVLTMGGLSTGNGAMITYAPAPTVGTAAISNPSACLGSGLDFLYCKGGVAILTVYGSGS